MNIESSFLSDRPAGPNEKESLPENLPKLAGQGRYEDLFSIDAALGIDGKPTVDEFYESLERWTFRLN